MKRRLDFSRVHKLVTGGNTFSKNKRSVLVHGIIGPANHAQISMRWLGFTPFEPKCGLIGPVCSMKQHALIDWPISFVYFYFAVAFLSG